MIHVKNNQTNKQKNPKNKQKKTCPLFQDSTIFLTFDKLFLIAMCIAASFNKIAPDKSTQSLFFFKCNFFLPGALKKIKEQRKWVKCHHFTWKDLSTSLY